MLRQALRGVGGVIPLAVIVIALAALAHALHRIAARALSKVWPRRPTPLGTIVDHPRRRASAARRWSSSRGHAQPRSAHGLELAGAGVPPHRAGSGRGRGCVPRSPACPEPRSTAQVRGSPGLERRSGARSVSSDPRGTSCAGAAAALSARRTPGIVRLPTPTSRHLVDPSVYGKRVPERDLPRSTGARQRRTCPAQHARPPRVHEPD